MRNGDVVHYFSIGPALLSSFFYLIVYIFRHILELIGINFSGSYLDFLPYLLSYNLASAFYGMIGLILSYKIAIKFFSKNASFWATLGIWLGSSAINYFYFEASFSHTFTLFSVSLFFYYWLNTLNKRTSYQWFFLGLLGGLMMLTRWQEAVFLLIPFVELVCIFFSRIKLNFFGKIQKGLFFIIGAILAFSPQIIVWKIVSGTWLTIPQGKDFLDLLHPHFLLVLFSSKHGLFTWTPIILVSILGIYFLYQKEKRLALALIFGFVLILCTNSFIVDWAGGDFCFGQRRFIDCSVIFILGLAGLYDYLSKKGLEKVYKIFTLLIIIWNILLLVQYRAHIINPDTGYIVWLTMIKNQFTVAPFAIIKLLGQSTFLKELYVGLIGINVLKLLAALGILVSYIITVYLIAYIFKKEKKV